MYVFITNNGKKYHTYGSKYLRKSNIQITIQEAEEKGLHPSWQMKQSYSYKAYLSEKAYPMIEKAVKAFQWKNNFHYNTFCMDEEDVVSTVMLRLLDKNAFEKYDPTRFYLSTYVGTITNNYLMNLRRDMVRRMKKVTNILHSNTEHLMDEGKLIYA